MRALIVCLVVSSSLALAEDDAQRRAREELERQLNSMVEKAPARVRVEFQPVDDPNFQVEDLELQVDGKALKAPTVAAISGWVQDGPMPVGAVDVTPGRHKVTAKATIHNTASALVSEEGDHRWKLTGDVAFEVAAGIEVRVVVSPTRDAKQNDVAKRLKLVFPSQPVMIAKLDDGAMPEPPKKVVVAPVDAGPTKEQLAAELAAQKKAADEAAKLAAADEKKRQAEALAEAKRLELEAKQQKASAAAEEKKRKLEEARAAKLAAAEEKKRKLEEARAAKLAAAEEKKRQLEEARAAKLAAAEEKKRLALGLPPSTESLDAGVAAVAAEPVDAGPAVAAAEPVDAGVAVAAAPVVAAAEPVDAGVAAPAPVPAPDEGPPWLVIGGVGGAVALVVIVLLARRAGRVPEIKD